MHGFYSEELHLLTATYNNSQKSIHITFNKKCICANSETQVRM